MRAQRSPHIFTRSFLSEALERDASLGDSRDALVIVGNPPRDFYCFPIRNKVFSNAERFLCTNAPISRVAQISWHFLGNPFPLLRQGSGTSSSENVLTPSGSASSVWLGVS